MQALEQMRRISHAQRQAWSFPEEGEKRPDIVAVDDWETPHPVRATLVRTGCIADPGTWSSMGGSAFMMTDFGRELLEEIEAAGVDGQAASAPGPVSGS